jgi:glycerol-3-phosphate dehydrogenase
MQPGEVFDLAIIGGGINGAGIAADAAGRGLKVVLFERSDLASGTSSASSKLIHGGLRYLEHREFRLVHEALAEREVLLGRAPHLIRPLRFVIPQVSGMRSPLLMRLGLLLYDHLAVRRNIPRSHAVDLTRDPAGQPLRPSFARGFSYYDCWVDDARLVVLAAMDASERGASIQTRAPVTALSPRGALWKVTADAGGRPLPVRARVVVNAAGPWCSDVAHLVGRERAIPVLRLVRGSHIVVPRIPGADDAYLLQHSDGRVVFVLPFERNFTLIGTTETQVISPASGFIVGGDEEMYLLEVASRFFSQSLAPSDIVWRFAGVRPLIEDGASSAGAVSRDYRLDVVHGDGIPPLLNVVGGKITTFRKLAETAVDRLKPFLPDMRSAWTAKAPLPGGDIGRDGPQAFLEGLAQRYEQLPRSLLQSIADRHGSRADRVLGDAKTMDDLGEDLGAGLTEREVIYLRDYEWAQTPDDVLWRRTKVGLHLDPDARIDAEQAISNILAR